MRQPFPAARARHECNAQSCEIPCEETFRDTDVRVTFFSVSWCCVTTEAAPLLLKTGKIQKGAPRAGERGIMAGANRQAEFEKTRESTNSAADTRSNPFAHATGRRIRGLPLTPDGVQAASALILGLTPLTTGVGATGRPFPPGGRDVS